MEAAYLFKATLDESDESDESNEGTELTARDWLRHICRSTEFDETADWRWKVDQILRYLDELAAAVPILRSMESEGVLSIIESSCGVSNLSLVMIKGEGSEVVIELRIPVRYDTSLDVPVLTALPGWVNQRRKELMQIQRRFDLLDRPYWPLDGLSISDPE